jgi:hypothetical protein
MALESARELGEVGWRRCDRCQALARPGGRCVAGAPGAPLQPHSTGASDSYTLPRNAPTVAGQPHWRICRNCASLSFRAGACFAGGTHDLAGSASYTVRTNAGQPGWRRCTNCQGLWFSGNGGRGRCPAPGGVHEPAGDDYVVPWR